MTIRLSSNLALQRQPNPYEQAGTGEEDGEGVR